MCILHIQELASEQTYAVDIHRQGVPDILYVAYVCTQVNPLAFLGYSRSIP